VSDHFAGVSKTIDGKGVGVRLAKLQS